MSARTVATAAFWVAVAALHAAAVTVDASLAGHLVIIAAIWIVVAGIYAWQIPMRDI